MDAFLEKLLKLCEKYQTDKKYVYKSCSNLPNKIREWLVVMEKCEDTITNEERKGVVDENHAKFRANKMRVTEIINMNDMKKEEYVVNYDVYGGKSLKYEVGAIVECDKFDNDIDVICSGGIHYFKMLMPAYYYRDKPIAITGKWIDWHDNGRKQCEENWKCGQIDGPYKEWQYDGEYNIICAYKNGNLDGPWIKWGTNGKKIEEYHYKNGILYGSWIRWYADGTMMDKRFYRGGRMDGLCTQWHANGQKMSEIDYVDGKIDREIRWDKNGIILNNDIWTGIWFPITSM